MGQKASLPQSGTTIQVIGAGLPRTGTASFSTALEILLQGPIFHCGTQATLGPPAQIKTWIKILRQWLSGTATDRHAMLQLLERQLDGYAAITDSPGSQFIPELMELYPEAKVICTVRDPASWERSMDQVMTLTMSWFLRWVLLPLPGMRYFIEYIHLLGDQWYRMYDEPLPTSRTYHRHLAWLRETVPADRLVFFDVKDGWAPLCRALGKEVPKDLPFPHVNDSDAIEKIARLHVRRGLARWAVLLAVAAAPVAWLLRR
ncbi:NAD dependent epimerase/dehydratase [Penicillium hispanicum]|uniref:NAD dependent epimerase/dehydratase n=1 Tax=Penicillium hispanicum TaxID=1080232 RepID=UPI0025419406|nr:NAD dependent epimerase/dehydratase [Penicillium hispanicum]KAJ5578516.1 NAD dependent epimerase/dehydratase [Penicillium hispanicum]